VSSANYVIIARHPDRLIIRDMGPWDQFKTVTNAAEIVVEELFANGDLARGQRLLYYDSESDLAEIVLDERGRFAGFRPAGEP